MDYSKHLSHKFKVAIAIAVLKTKPPNMTTDQYLAQLQHSVKSREKDMDFDCISIASIDFEDDGNVDTAEFGAEFPISINHIFDVCPQTGNKDPRKEIVQQDTDLGKCNAEKNDRTASIFPYGVPKLKHPTTDSQETYFSLENIQHVNDFTQNVTAPTQEYGQIFNFDNEMVPEINNYRSTDPNEITTDSVINFETSKSAQDKRMEMDDDMFSQSQDFFSTTHANIVQEESYLETDNKIRQYHESDVNATKNQIANSADVRITNRQATDIENTELAQTLTYLTEKTILNEISANTTHHHKDKITKNNNKTIEKTTQESQKNYEPATQKENRMDLLSQALEELDEDENIVPIEIEDEVTKGVPFKVIMELNRVKNILSKAEGNTDHINRQSLEESGYKSDSQLSFSQMSITSGALSESNINQSAHCLLTHISACPAALLRHPVTRDAAAALARLVDVTQERATAPAFLEDLLVTVDGFMQDIFKEGCGADLLIQREDRLSRLCLLSKSIEISSYSIDKILDYLDKFRHRFTPNAESACEVSNIDEMESVCYVFHTLEVLLSKYLEKNKTQKSIGTTRKDVPATQKDIQLSISDIWRKRWDPNYNSASKQIATKQTKDVTDRCVTLLNKFIVAYMDRYSLISYAALECFNSLQNSD